MNPFYIFLLRVALSVIISVVICMLFFQELAMDKVLGLSALLVALAYLFEYLKSVGKDDKNP